MKKIFDGIRLYELYVTNPNTCSQVIDKNDDAEFNNSLHISLHKIWFDPTK